MYEDRSHQVKMPEGLLFFDDKSNNKDIDIYSQIVYPITSKLDTTN